MAEKRAGRATARSLADLAAKPRPKYSRFAPARLPLGQGEGKIEAAAVQEELSCEGHQVRRLGILGLAICFGLCSCAALNPKNWPVFSGQKGNKPPEQNTTLVPESPTSPPPPSPPGRTTSSQGSGILAGQVIDAYHQRRPYATIQVSLADGGEAPREVQTDAQGYFVVQGLKPGQRYKLVAKVRLGEKLLTGVTYATPPNVVVNIIVREDLSENESGHGPGNNAARKPEESGSPTASPQSWRPANTQGMDGNPWSPGRWGSAKGAGQSNGDGPATPAIPVGAPGPKPSPPPVSPRLEIPGRGLAPNIGSPAGSPMLKEVPAGPLVNSVPWPGAAAGPQRSATPQLLSVPGCRVVANRLEDFALFDLSGQAFHWREAPARLTLLDFWGTWCRPCLNSLPHLVDLQRRYGPRGLQVIGIAYEDGSPAEQQQRVNFVRQRLGLNYRVLLGQGDHCPVKNALAVHSFPTLILLDEQGNILWRTEGLDSSQLAQLENEIRRRLH